MRFTIWISALFITLCWVGLGHARSEREPSSPHRRVLQVSHDKAPGTFDSVAAALDAAEALRKKDPGVALRIVVAPGDYYQDTPLHIGPELSGRDGQPTEIVAANGSMEPRILAGRPLTVQWEPYRNGIFQTHVDGAAFDRLYVNGQRMIRARYPNVDRQHPGESRYAADAISPKRVTGWRDPAGGVLHALHEKRWGDMQVPILGKDRNGALVLGPAVGNNRPSSPSGTERYVENIFEELDTPGEWYLDVEHSTLYLLPPPGVDLAHAQIAAGGPPRLFDICANSEAHGMSPSR